MTLKALRLLILLAAFSFGVCVNAYEQPTHEDMSQAAAFTSVLGNSDVLSELGLKYSISDKKQQFPNSKGTSGTILDLIRDGARFEDGFNDCESRPRNHFFDPKYDRPLTVFGLYLGERSPDWALEDTKIVSGQEYSFHYAREYLYKALMRSTEDERNKFFGLTFQTLGHVIHHLQDMAQPQHVRNDAHCDRWYCIGDLYNPSLYEKWTNAHRRELPRNGPRFLDSGLGGHPPLQ